MDAENIKRSEWKLFSIENNKLALDDKISFSCDNCGNCCRNQEDLIVTPFDIFRMAKHLGLTMLEWVNLYGRVHIGADSRMPVVRIKLIGETRRCPFLRDNRCSLHRIKPDVCALFPIGRDVRYKKGRGYRNGQERSVIFPFGM